MSYTVGQVARIAKVTVRALHYYDQCGLLHPSERRDSGYRGYTQEDLERLQRILCYRHLGFSLDRIKAALADPETDGLVHLRRQHALLLTRINELQQMAATVKTLMEAQTMGIQLEPHEFLEVFGDTDLSVYAEEAERTWQRTNAWDESQRRTATYTKDDWKRMQAESAALMQALAESQSATQDASSVAAMDLAEAHRAHLSHWFYDCSYVMHCRLGDLYVNDPRFMARFARVAPDLASYLRDAIYANAARHSSEETSKKGHIA